MKKQTWDAMASLLTTILANFALQNLMILRTAHRCLQAQRLSATEAFQSAVVDCSIEPI
ncbi:hypothetical protein [Stenomitos frigidus]|uniref:hypothetical protein n=1 Tax=Stenomitos frigidus TaxID=1886765 RepID=UPI0015E7DD1F|nr:hypothetical protein [Stenomitos frigidus]